MKRKPQPRTGSVMLSVRCKAGELRLWERAAGDETVEAWVRRVAQRAASAAGRLPG